MKHYCPYCGKEQFPRRADAEQAANSLASRKFGSGSVYWCEGCHTYHITHYSYESSRRLRQNIAASKKDQRKKQKDMKIIIDGAYMPDCTSVGIKQLDDGGKQLQIIVMDEDKTALDMRYTYEQGLELAEAIKLQLAKIT